MEKQLIVEYEKSATGDTAMLVIAYRKGDRIFGLNSFYGEEATRLYKKLTEPAMAIKINMLSTAAMERDHWLMGCQIMDWGGNWVNPFFVPADSAVNPLVISKEQLEAILKEPTKSGPGALLHNKDCPYGYKCKAMDCIECMEIYGKEEQTGSKEVKIEDTFW